MNAGRLRRPLLNVLSATPSREEALESLRVAMAGEPELSLFDDKMYYKANSWTRATLEGLSRWLLDRSLAVGPDMALGDLARYLVTDHVPHTRVMVLAGVHVDRTIQLDRQIQLVPFRTLRATHWKDHIATLFAEFHENHRPAAALLQATTYPRRHIDPGAQATFAEHPYRELDDVRLCMTSIGPSAPVWLGSWTDLDEWVPDVGGWGAAIPPVFEIGGYAPDVATDWAELPELHAAWCRLSERERQHLRVPLSRLNTSLRRRHYIDKAIDLGIALDALFLAEREADRGELSLTLRLRAARFLAADVAERKKLAKTLSSLYRMRSAAVHSGNLPDEVDGVRIKALLRLGNAISSQAIRRIIREGEPDWHTLLLS